MMVKFVKKVCGAFKVEWKSLESYLTSVRPRRDG
jgi:hypothetical protein